MWNNDQPLWLPGGSVRALLAVFITVLVAADLVPIEAGFLVWGFYFAERAGKS